jgi:hypothetical protein
MTTPGGPAPANNAMGGSAVGGVPIGTAGSPFASNNERWSNNVQTEHPFNNFVNRYTPRLGQQIATTSAQGVAKQFPNVIERGDSRDDYYNFRASVTDGRGNIPGMGMTVAGDNDIAYLRKKGQDAIEAAFNGYLLDQMVLNTPEAQDYWQKNFPDVFQEKIKLVEDQLDIQAKLAKIRILGPKTREDYMLLFAIQHGYIAVPAGPVFDPNSLEKTDFHRGGSSTSRSGSYPTTPPTPTETILSDSEADPLIHPSQKKRTSCGLEQLSTQAIGPLPLLVEDPEEA